MDSTTSLYNDILSYLQTTDPTRLSLYIQAATSDSRMFNSPTIDHCADLTSEARRSLGSPNESWVGQAAMRDGYSEVSLLHQTDSEIHCRYKTELCRPFEESGFCKYGNICQFAHGRQELKTVDRHPKYKTQLCKTFHTTGLCRYGKRCHFIHNDDESGQIRRLGPLQQQQHHQHHHQLQQQQSVPVLRKLTGRQNLESAEEHQLQRYSNLTGSFSSSISRYAEELSPVSGMSLPSLPSLPSSTASSPSPSLASFNDDIFTSSAALEITQFPIFRNVPTSPHSAFFGATDRFAHPSTLPSATADSASVQPKGFSIRDDGRSHKEVVDLLLRHLTKPQSELLIEYLVQTLKEKRPASSNMYWDGPLNSVSR